MFRHVVVMQRHSDGNVTLLFKPLSKGSIRLSVKQCHDPQVFSLEALAWAEVFMVVFERQYKSHEQYWGFGLSRRAALVSGIVQKDQR
jgi:hypothetical protein